MTMEEAKAAGYDLIIFPHTTDVENNICVRVHRNTGFEVVIFEEEIAHTLVKVVAIKRTKTTGTAAAVKAQKKFKTTREFILGE